MQRRQLARLAPLLLCAVVLTGCAQSAPPSESASASAPSGGTDPAPTSQAPAPSPTSSPTPATQEPRADWQPVETPNGTATFRIPPGWTAQIDGEEQQHGLETHWRNSIAIVDATGAERLSYGDGPGDESGPVQPFGVLVEERVETLDADAVAQSIGADPALLQHWARAWWQGGIDGNEVTARVGLTTGSPGEQPTFALSDGHRLVFFGTRARFATVDEAEAWLERDETALLLEIVSTLELSSIPAPALPEG